MAITVDTLGSIQSLGNMAIDFMQLNGVAKKLEHNARMNEINKVYSDITAKVSQDRLRRERDTVVGRQVNSYAASGVLLSGSPLEVIMDTFHNYEKDILYTGINADIEKNSLDSRAGSLRGQASLYNTAKSTSFLTSLVSSADKYIKVDNTGKINSSKTSRGDE